MLRICEGIIEVHGSTGAALQLLNSETYLRVLIHDSSQLSKVLLWLRLGPELGSIVASSDGLR